MISMTAHDLRMRLGRLTAERFDAIAAGLGDDVGYISMLEHDLAATRAAYVTLAVTEIASLRGALAGAQAG
jgi:hypothetical protein